MKEIFIFEVVRCRLCKVATYDCRRGLKHNIKNTGNNIFENNGETTKVTTIFDAETVNPVEMQQSGWQIILNKFKRFAFPLNT